MVNKVCVAAMAVLLLSGQAVAGEQLFGRARVVDGDTLAVGGIRVRLEGVAAPEIAHPGPALRKSRAVPQLRRSCASWSKGTLWSAISLVIARTSVRSAPAIGTGGTSGPS